MYLLLQADQRLKQDHEDLLMLPNCERRWTDIEPGTQSSFAYPVAKREKTLFGTENYLEKKMGRLNSGD